MFLAAAALCSCTPAAPESWPCRCPPSGSAQTQALVGTQHHRLSALDMAGPYLAAGFCPSLDRRPSRCFGAGHFPGQSARGSGGGTWRGCSPASPSACPRARRAATAGARRSALDLSTKYGYDRSCGWAVRAVHRTIVNGQSLGGLWAASAAYGFCIGTIVASVQSMLVQAGVHLAGSRLSFMGTFALAGNVTGQAAMSIIFTQLGPRNMMFVTTTVFSCATLIFVALRCRIRKMYECI